MALYIDPIADLLTRIRNASSVGFREVDIPASKKKEAILGVLKDGGYVGEYEQIDQGKGKKTLRVNLRYSTRGVPVIRKIDRLSKPGRRHYVGKDKIPYYKGGLGLVVLSTSKGMMSAQQARQEGIGGEVVCSVF